MVGMSVDVVIVGGGPAGLSAALALGRGRKRALVVDAGTPRNARAVEMHNVVTRDGTPPPEFRRLAWEELARYPSIAKRTERVLTIEGELGAFDVTLETGVVRARRVLLAVGMIDELPDTPGFQAHWGRSIFQCPYCHAWEVQDRRFGVLASSVDLLDFAIFVRGWSRDVIAFTDGGLEVPEDIRQRLVLANVGLEERPVRALHGGEHLEAIELEGGERVAREVLFARPPQRQTDIVRALGVDLDAQGFVRVDESQQTSRAGIYAAGDLTTFAQGATMAIAAGTLAAARLNHELTRELVLAAEI